jgi:LysR family glycine cleavage system transcriptional activator
MARRLPSLNALRAFEAAARHLSFARAADELHVTPAAVSQLIKQLETALDVVLFKRGKQLALSESASAAIPFLTEAFDRLELAANRLRGGNGAGPLVLSMPPTFAARWLIPRLEDFQAQHPDIELRLLATRRLVDFAVEDVDLAVRFSSGPFEGLHAEKLMREAIVPVAAPTVAANITSPSDLLSCTLLHDEAHDWDPAFPSWDVWLASLGVNVERPLRIRHFGDANLVIQAAATGLGVALVWQSLVVDELRAGRLVRLLGESVATNHGYHLVIPPKRLHLDKVAIFRTWILAQAKQ